MFSRPHKVLDVRVRRSRFGCCFSVGRRAQVDWRGYSSREFSTLAHGVTVAHLILVQRVEVQIFVGQLGQPLVVRD